MAPDGCERHGFLGERYTSQVLPDMLEHFSKAHNYLQILIKIGQSLKKQTLPKRNNHGMRDVNE